jgi:hypothetical protein
VGTIENERNIRKGALPTLRFDQSEIVGSPAAVNALPRSRPPLVLACEMEIVRFHGAESILDGDGSRHDNIAQPCSFA